MSEPTIPQIRIQLIDDHRIVRAGLRMLIESRPGMQIVGEAADRAGALAMSARERPDLILLDLDLHGESSLDFLPELLAAGGGARVLVLTGVRDPDAHRRALQLGARGVVQKDDSTDQLIAAIEKVHAGEVWLDGSVMSTQLAPARQPEPDPETARIAALTAREREIITLVAEGLKNRQIGECLYISEGTVRNHLTVTFEKLAVEDRFGLIVFAFRYGLVKSPAHRLP